MDVNNKRSLEQISPESCVLNSAKKHLTNSPAIASNTFNASTLVPSGLALTASAAKLTSTVVHSVSLLPAQTAVLKTGVQLSPALQTSCQSSGVLLSPALQTTCQSSGVPPLTALVSDMSDSFSWAMFDAKLNTALDIKLQDVAKKSDLQSICVEIQQLREENAHLKEDLKLMKSRLEHVEQYSKRSNIVVTGLNANLVKPAIVEFEQLNSTILKTSINVTDVRRLPTGNGFVFSLNSALEADAVIAARAKLKGSSIFIQKDSTAEERHKMYNLRQLGKNIRKIDGSLKIRHGHSRIYINDKMFTWANGNAITSKAADADFLRRLVAKANYNCNVIVSGNSSAAATSSASTSSAATSLAVTSSAGTSFAATLSPAAPPLSSPFHHRRNNFN